MFGHRYFGARYFGPRYFGPGIKAVVIRKKEPEGVKIRKHKYEEEEDLLLMCSTLMTFVYSRSGLHG
jgi:hypothetical protein